MQEINFNQNNNFFNFNNLDSTPPIQTNGNIDQMLSDLFQSLSNLFDNIGSGQFHSGGFPGCGCTSPPVFEDSSHPSGTLQADGNKVSTPGGYEIEPMSKFEWKITGPDGKTTRIWGDPHVAEGDGGKWDFKRDSTFMLPDGTKINVTTAPWKNGSMTVTSGLEIINGNDRVLVSDIDKGKGNIGKVTPDGFQHANSFGGKDVFVMGKESDDWSYQGKEIIGSNKGGESFKLGNDLAPGVTNTNWLNNTKDLISQFVDNLLKNWSQIRPMNNPGINPYNDSSFNDIFNNDGTNSNRHRNNIRQGFTALSDMFDALSRLAGLDEMMFLNRNRSISV